MALLFSAGYALDTGEKNVKGMNRQKLQMALLIILEP